MDPCQINGIDELKILQDVQHETNMKYVTMIITEFNFQQFSYYTYYLMCTGLCFSDQSKI